MIKHNTDVLRVTRSHRGVFAVSLLLAALMQPLVSIAEDAPAAKSEVDKNSKRSANARVCKKVKVTGSRVPERQCRKQRDWDRLEEESEESVRRSVEGGHTARGES